ncbi:uncharacterized protein LOC124545762, partial [Schistocerca americana]|uniref:uncharacterized protein LOC124545762 n=1 Tax=Schistocerca americana TaxID=7009 RepID=UPI001F4F2D37
SVEKIPSSPALYYDSNGKVQIYSVTWKFVSYIHLGELQAKADETERFAHLSISYCKRKLTSLRIGDRECTAVEQALQSHVRKIRIAQGLNGQLTRHETLRKRGVLNFVEEISKILFGTLDEQDASIFKSKIGLTESEQRQLLKLTKEQVTVVKATLTSFNHTVSSLARNEEIIVKNMEKLHRHMNEYANSTDQKIQHLAVLTTINEQLIQLVSIFMESEREYELLIAAIVNAQKGILEPHIINPVQIVKYLQLIRGDIKDKKFPTALTERSGNQLLRTIDVDPFLSGNILSYVLNVPLVENELFNLCKALPLPSEVDGNQNLFNAQSHLNHQWLFVAPKEEGLTVLCNDNKPTDVLVKEQRNVSELKSDMPLEHVVKHLDDLKVNCHKIAEIEEETAFQEQHSFSEISWYHLLSQWGPTSLQHCFPRLQV